MHAHEHGTFRGRGFSETGIPLHFESVTHFCSYPWRVGSSILTALRSAFGTHHSSAVRCRMSLPPHEADSMFGYAGYGVPHVSWIVNDFTNMQHASRPHMINRDPTTAVALACRHSAGIGTIDEEAFCHEPLKLIVLHQRSC